MSKIKIETGKPLRDHYNPAYIESIGQQLQAVWSDFDKQAFANRTLDSTWDDLELKGRMERIAEVLDDLLPEDFAQATSVLDQVAPDVDGLLGMFAPAFVAVRVRKHGAAIWQVAADAMARYTEFASSEFAVRTLLLADQQRMLDQMLTWASSSNEHVRRLASEGCRPRLPWAMALPELKRDPTSMLPILEALRSDPSEYVRRSVANNLNDVAKDHPKLVLQIAKRWLGEDAADPVNRRRMVKHACRTLLKSGEPKAMLLFGFRDPSDLAIEALNLDQDQVAIGATIKFSFRLKGSVALGRLRVEYVVHFVKANGSQSPKVFKISEFESDELSRSVARSHSFRDLSTRRHHPGTHAIAIIINGVEKARVHFELTT